MPPFYFERECRTPSSECYVVFEDGTQVGRLDLHFAPGMVHGTLVVAESLTQDAIQELLTVVDQDIVDAVGVERDEFVVHIHQGRDLGVYANPDYADQGDGHPPEGT